MKVFIAGATGALGLPLARELVRDGHEVVGLTRTPARRALIEAAGARAVVADALNGDALEAVVRAAAPTHVVHALTALPKAGPMRAADLVDTNRLRIAGTRNVLRAAIAAGATRIVGESFIGIYGLGDHGSSPLAEDAPPLPARSPAVQQMIDATRSLEEQLLEANRRGAIEAVILRYGAFYGPQTESTLVRLDAVRRRKLPVIRGDAGLLPFIQLDDAVRATIAAMVRGRPGAIYNIVDDRAASISEVTREMAAVVRAPRPWAVPQWVVRLAMPYLAEFAATRLPLSNARARRELDWRPRFPTYREGLRDLVERVA